MAVPMSVGEGALTLQAAVDLKRRREVTKVQQLEGELCREAISLLEQIFMKMRETFQHRQKLIHDPEQCSTVLTVFPRFLDTKGLVSFFVFSMFLQCQEQVFKD